MTYSTLKLFDGTELIGEILAEKKRGIVLKRPLLINIMLSPNGGYNMYLTPWISLMVAPYKAQDEIRIPWKNIAFLNVDPNQSFVQTYIKQRDIILAREDELVIGEPTYTEEMNEVEEEPFISDRPEHDEFFFRKDKNEKVSEEELNSVLNDWNIDDKKAN